MDEKTISKKDLQSLLGEMLTSCRVLAPVKKGGCLSFEEIGAADEICLDCLNTKASVKGKFFPQRERLFAFKGNEISEPSFPDMPRVIFGVRPCDAQSLVLLDKVFSGSEYPDPYYLNSRKNTLVIALGCSTSESTCFCTSLGGDPFSGEGADVLMVDVGDSYSMQALTEKGEIFLAEKKEFKNAGNLQQQAKEKVMASSREAMSSAVQPEAAKKNLDKNFDDPLWAALHEKCLGCGVCTFLCPTCHCFDIFDEASGASGERVRIWDSCMFPQFTLHASGSNPRPGGRERVRQRVMHKFKYFVDNFGRAACTGCGRCIKYCPVNMDIRQIVKQIEQM